jgi:hypothetical protein
LPTAHFKRAALFPASTVKEVNKGNLLPGEVLADPNFDD